MEIGQLEAFIQIGAVTTILLLAWLLFRRRREVGAPGILFMPMAICLSCIVIRNSPAPLLGLSGIPEATAHLASGYTVIFLWWFCLSCFESQFKLRGSVLAGGLIWAALASADRGLLGSALAEKGLSYILLGLGFGIVGHLIWRLLAEREGDLIPKRYNARVIVVVLLGCQLLIDLCIDAVFGFAWHPLAFTMFQNVTILGFSLWFASRLLQVQTEFLTFAEAPLRAAPQGALSDDASYDLLQRKLVVLIEAECVYLDPELTFAAFVQQMEAPERLVRRLINIELGFDHFRTFLNHYRVAEARRLLADPTRAEDKLIGIALDSGFASIPSFNRVFRAIESCTPSEYRAAALTGRSPAVQ